MKIYFVYNKYMKLTILNRFISAKCSTPTSNPASEKNFSNEPRNSC